MPNVTITVGGSPVVIPGVYYQDKLATVVPLAVPTGPLVFIAASYGVAPFTPTNFTDPNSLIAAMRGAPSADFVNFMFQPSVQLNGAALVTLINSAPNTQSTANFLSSGAVTVITATSNDYGTPSNLLQYTIAGGSIAGKALTLLDGFSGLAVTGDNLGVPFQLAYAGTASGVAYSVQSTIAGRATKLQITSPNQGESVTIDLTSQTYSTISQVVQYLNGTGYYTANVISNGLLPSYYLDLVTTAPLPGSANAALAVTQTPHGFAAGQTVTVTGNATGGFNTTAVIASVPSPTSFVYTVTGSGLAPGNGGSASVVGVGTVVVSSISQPDTQQLVNITATLGDIVNFINTSNPGFATAVVAIGITSTPGQAPANTALGYFTGATNAVPSLNNYATALNAALLVPAWVVFIDSNSSGVRALGAQHALQASQVNYRAWRRYVTGSALGETPATSQTNAVGLNQYQVTYLWPGIQKTNVATGLTQVYDGLHVAAAVAGMMVGNSVPTPLTNKTLIGLGVEQTASLAQMIAMQNSGVMVLNFPQPTRIPTLLSDVTTWQNDPNPANVFNQQVSCRFALAYYLTNQLQPYVGNIASSIDITRVQNAVKVMLNAIIYTDNNSIGILNSWDPNTLVLTYDGSTGALSVTVSVIFVNQIRFIPVTVTVQPLNLTINAQGQVTQTLQ